MYQLNETEFWREHRDELLREASTRRPRAAHSERGYFLSAMRRRVALLLSTMGFAILLMAGAAYALDVIQCGPSVVTPCLGTEGPNVMNGTKGSTTSWASTRSTASPPPTGSRATATLRSRATTSSSAAPDPTP
jgi:hypothetical protein